MDDYQSNVIQSATNSPLLTVNECICNGITWHNKTWTFRDIQVHN